MPLNAYMPMMRDLPKQRSGASMYRMLIQHNDPNLVDKLMAQLTPMFRMWVMHEAERIGRMPLLGPAEKARLAHAVQLKLGHLDAKTAEVSQRLILLLVLTEAARQRTHGEESQEEEPPPPPPRPCARDPGGAKRDPQPRKNP